MTIDLQQCWSITCRGCAKPLERGPEDDRSLMLFFSPGPYLELFARRNRLGWDTVGNECLDFGVAL